MDKEYWVMIGIGVMCFVGLAYVVFTPDAPAVPHPRGSGHDENSDHSRLADAENMQDKMVEDSFPASDPPSMSPIHKDRM